ncbi:hypothetical protein H9Y04_42265 [Streptomyces sp. TRM66268-LWL]|uniref:Uncharacterized protein n=1 Tax=Streptomyces polyasparticus TaxID=2767826 RepID=A0ABR7SX19_9ACTN|nr:hypothetical protein [Streptomyces polyasparticus]MBC9719157.1 hypothetical protein [Streptomyces polyasparticus]
MHQKPPPPGEPDPTAVHHTSTVEQGKFCLAHCTCGWRGPARRARSKARSDALEHANA